MIRGVRADQDGFRPVAFERGFNVVLADRTTTSGQLDSRNGVGKSTLLEVIDFGLGARRSSLATLKSSELNGWTFYVDLEVDGRLITVARNTTNAQNVYFTGDATGWPIQPTIRADGQTYTIPQWTSLLGLLMFGLDPNREGQYGPSFRGLISFFLRSGRQAYSDPFETFAKQRQWSRQALTAFLLGLDWEIAAQWQILKDRRNFLRDLRRGVQTGAVESLLGSTGELEAERIRLESVHRRQRQDLAAFRVHPQYTEIERQANELTESIHGDVNANVIDLALIETYETALRDETPPSRRSIEILYRDAGAVFQPDTLRHLADVETFHRNVTQNRRQFLGAELERLRRQRAQRLVHIRTASDSRAELMELLSSHGALEEYVGLQEHHHATGAMLEAVRQRIAVLREVDEGESQVRVEEELLRQRADLSLIERTAQREAAVTAFNEYTLAMYESPGNLVIDVGSEGYKFDVEILRAGSGGVEHMQVFAFDMVLATLWSQQDRNPGFLIHDSIVFEGVDERQVAAALGLAKSLCTTHGYQYICMLNSDQIPTADLPEDFGLDSSVRITLNDQPAADSLLGRRF